MDDQIVPLPFPQGVMDPAGAIAYIADAGGGISAIDLNTGGVLWSTTEAERPLLSLGDRLAALHRQDAHTLLALALDTSRAGAVTLRSDSIDFPDWVVLDLRNTEQFTLSAYARDQLLLMDWEARSFYKGGAAPSQQVLQQESRIATGTVQIDLKTGHVALLARAAQPPQAEAPSPAPEPPVADRNAREVQIVGSRAYYLVSESTRAGFMRTLLRAMDLASGRIIWELPLEERRITQRPPLRQ